MYIYISPYQHDFHRDFVDVVMAEDQKQQAKDDLDAAMALLDLRARCDGTRMPWKNVGKPWKNMEKWIWMEMDGKHVKHHENTWNTIVLPGIFMDLPL